VICVLRVTMSGRCRRVPLKALPLPALLRLVVVVVVGGVVFVVAVVFVAVLVFVVGVVVTEMPAVVGEMAGVDGVAEVRV